MAASVISRRIRRRPGIAALELFVAAGAVYGGVSLLADADGFGMRTEWLRGSPFPDYTVPGIALLVGIGGGMAAAAVLALLGNRRSVAAARLMGSALLAFLSVETAVLGYRGPMQLVLLAAMSVPGLMLVSVRREAAR